MWTCPKCKKQNPDTVNFCPSCGSKKNSKQSISTVTILTVLTAVLSLLLIILLLVNYTNIFKSKDTSSNTSADITAAATPQPTDSVDSTAQASPSPAGTDAAAQQAPDTIYNPQAPVPVYPAPAVPYVPNQVTPKPLMPVSYTFSRQDRTNTFYFKNSMTSYNVFPFEISNCYGIDFYYSAQTAKDAKHTCEGRRDVYIRNMADEKANNDSGWVYVGYFDYPKEKEAVHVSLTWAPQNVYAVAVIRNSNSTNANVSYSANWGSSVVFYAYQ